MLGIAALSFAGLASAARSLQQQPAVVDAAPACASVRALDSCNHVSGCGWCGRCLATEDAVAAGCTHYEPRPVDPCAGQANEAACAAGGVCHWCTGGAPGFSFRPFCSSPELAGYVPAEYGMACAAAVAGA